MLAVIPIKTFDIPQFQTGGQAVGLAKLINNRVGRPDWLNAVHNTLWTHSKQHPKNQSDAPGLSGKTKQM